MSTPFEYIRRHQKVALTAVTGMAILSFLLIDVSNGGRLSPMALASLIVGCFAVVGWVWGASEGKSSENAIFGGVLGLALTLVFMFMSRPPAAVTATSGNITSTELGELSRTRAIANRKVKLVYIESIKISLLGYSTLKTSPNCASKLKCRIRKRIPEN